MFKRCIAYRSTYKRKENRRKQKKTAKKRQKVRTEFFIYDNTERPEIAVLSKFPNMSKMCNFFFPFYKTFYHFIYYFH